MKKLPDVDLAIVQFTSSVSYPVAKIGNSDEATEGTKAYLAGFPQATREFPTQFTISPRDRLLLMPQNLCVMVTLWFITMMLYRE